LEARAGNVRDAASAADRAMPIVEERASPTSPDFWIATRDAAVVMRLAARPADAEHYARQSLAASQAQHLSDSDPRLGNSWDQLGQALEARGNKTEAIRCLEQAAAIYLRAGPVWTSTKERTEKRIEQLRGAR
jgi:hypothetical protein